MKATYWYHLKTPQCRISRDMKKMTRAVRSIREQMTKEQYKKYDKIQEELRPVKWFLNWCGDRYKDKSVSKYRFRIITKAKQFFLYKDIYFARDKEVEIPKDLQKRIVEVIEDWVDEKEQELKNI